MQSITNSNNILITFVPHLEQISVISVSLYHFRTKLRLVLFIKLKLKHMSVGFKIMKLKRNKEKNKKTQQRRKWREQARNIMACFSTQVLYERSARLLNDLHNKQG